MLTKELRECALIAVLALLGIVHFVGEGMGLPLLPLARENSFEIPFLNSTREGTILAIAIAAAVLVGLYQTLIESWRQTTLFLLHRPARREHLFYGKLAAGSLLLVTVIALPLAVYALWAAAPGTHASPFYWSMTEPWWRIAPAALVCYLGAFLSGLRPANWVGSRVWPLLPAIAAAVALKYIPVWPPLMYAGFVAVGALLLSSILETARTREYP